MTVRPITPPGPIRFVEPIGRHLASLNLFYEQDDTVEITVAGGAMHNLEQLAKKRGVALYPPIDFIEDLIIEAAKRIEARRAKR